ncbi:MAG: metallophosphoesterase [Peptococcaceae bacterium]
MEKLKAGLFYSLGRVYLSPDLLANSEPKLLHISDTPAGFYAQLKRIITKVKPHYIVHTGDLIDDIKLNLNASRIKEYTQGVSRLIEMLESSSAREIYITMGNHDNKEAISKEIARSILYENSAVVSIENTEFKISHYAKYSLRSPADFNLFGHDLTLKSQILKGKFFLNGIQNINIIALNSKKVFSLPYPLGTNESRLGKFKIGM